MLPTSTHTFRPVKSPVEYGPHHHQVGQSPSHLTGKRLSQKKKNLTGKSDYTPRGRRGFRVTSPRRFPHPFQPLVAAVSAQLFPPCRRCPFSLGRCFLRVPAEP
ncbi:hypothetical protein VPH35_118892 [Triticum aestivum]